MQKELLQTIEQLNPWLGEQRAVITGKQHYVPRLQIDELLHPEWDSLWTILIGPRRAGKTTLAKHLASALIDSGRFEQVLYLNCDYLNIRQWLHSPLFINEALTQFALHKPIIILDEVQRLDAPGLLLKAMIDLNLPVKLIATGSSQLEIKSKVQEHLTGRQLAVTVLPFSINELALPTNYSDRLLYGSYPQVVPSQRPQWQVNEIYKQYIQKDIIEILRISKADVLQQLLGLVAHQVGQLINYNQLATDCKVSVNTITHYLSILEQTYVLAKVTPFVGNKRTELTSNPCYYFIDNGFRHAALRNFSEPETRTDLGFMVEQFVFQELLKAQSQFFWDVDIHFWRTKSGAEVDFVLYKNQDCFFPIEVKYRGLKKAGISRGFHSFLSAYQPPLAFVITKDLYAKMTVEQSEIHFIPFSDLTALLLTIKNSVGG